MNKPRKPFNASTSSATYVSSAPYEKSSKTTTSNMSSQVFCLGARTRLPLYVRLTPARTADTVVTGRSSVPAGSVLAAEAEHPGTSWKSVHWKKNLCVVHEYESELTSDRHPTPRPQQLRHRHQFQFHHQLLGPLHQFKMVVSQILRGHDSFLTVVGGTTIAWHAELQFPWIEYHHNYGAMTTGNFAMPKESNTYRVSMDRRTTSRKIEKDSDAKWFTSRFQESETSPWRYPATKYRTLRLSSPAPQSFEVRFRNGDLLFSSYGWDFRS